MLSSHGYLAPAPPLRANSQPAYWDTMSLDALTSDTGGEFAGLQAGMTHTVLPQDPVSTFGTTTASPSHARRKWCIQRSRSNPNMRLLSGDEGSASSAAEKRRNKLGYHRTAVACGQLAIYPGGYSNNNASDICLGHCRKRKIRCVTANDDPSSRCQNCIRLKKECHFFPVENPPLLVKRSRSGSKQNAESTDADTSGSPSSPLLASGLDQIGDLNGSQIDPLTVSQPMPYERHLVVSPRDQSISPSDHDNSVTNRPSGFIQDSRVAAPVGLSSYTPWNSTSPFQHSPQPFQHSPHQIETPRMDDSWAATDSRFSLQQHPNRSMPPPGTVYTAHDSPDDYIHQHSWAQTLYPLRSTSVGGLVDRNYNSQSFVPETHHLLKRSITYTPELGYSDMGYHSFPTPPGSQPRSAPGTLSFDEPNSAAHVYPLSWTSLSGPQPPILQSSDMELHTPHWYNMSPGLPHVPEEYEHRDHPP